MKNKVITALISLGLSIALWFYVVTVVSPNSDKRFYNIPVTIQSEVVLQERGLMITTVDMPRVSLHLEGNRTDLNKLNSSNITIAVDVSRIGEPGTHNLSYTASYPGDVPNNAITVLNRNPGTVALTVEERVNKSIPVVVRYIGVLPEDYMADKENKKLDYENISITGPKSVIDQISMARIDVNLDNRVESISEQFAYVLCDAKGEPVDAALVTTEAEKLTLTMRIVRVKQLSLSVNILEGGGATRDNCTIKIEPATIRVSGSHTILSEMETLELETIDLSEISENTTITYPIRLPEGITNETGVLEAVVSIGFPGLSTKKVTVTNFQLENIPEGLKADIITQRLEILLRGPKNSLKNVTASDLVVTVSFADEQVGTATVKADISVKTKDVGAVGTYNVVATLKEA